jgi:hypothetical protein
MYVTGVCVVYLLKILPTGFQLIVQITLSQARNESCFCSIPLLGLTCSVSFFLKPVSVVIKQQSIVFDLQSFLLIL